MYFLFKGALIMVQTDKFAVAYFEVTKVVSSIVKRVRSIRNYTKSQLLPEGITIQGEIPFNGQYSIYSYIIDQQNNLTVDLHFSGQEKNVYIQISHKLLLINEKNPHQYLENLYKIFNEVLQESIEHVLAKKVSVAA